MRILVVVFLALSTVPVVGCSRGRKAEAAEPAAARPVKTETAQLRDVRRQVDVVGTLAAREEVRVSAEVEGRVARLVHDLGDRVTAGDRPRRARTRRSCGSRRGAARGAGTGAGPLRRAPDGELPPLDRMPEVVSAAAQLADAQQQSNARKNLAVAQPAVAVGSRRGKDEGCERPRPRTSPALAVGETAARRHRRAGVLACVSPQRELRDAVIRAPFDGYVAERLVSPGQYVRPQEPIMRIVRLQPLKLTAEVPESSRRGSKRAARWRSASTRSPVRFSRQDRPNRPVGEPEVARLCDRGRSAESGRPAEARHVRARADHDRPRRSCRHDPRRRSSEPLRHQPRVRRQAADSWSARNRARRSTRRAGRGLQGLEAGTTIVATDVEQLGEGMQVK